MVFNCHERDRNTSTEYQEGIPQYVSDLPGGGQRFPTWYMNPSEGSEIDDTTIPSCASDKNPARLISTIDLKKQADFVTIPSSCQYRSENMTLIIGVPCANGDIVVASDSRSTQVSPAGQYTFSDTEQKIFLIENSSILFAVSGSNRLAPKNKGFADLAYLLKGNNDIEAVVSAIEKRLTDFSFLQARTKIFVVDVTCPNVFAVIQLQNNGYRHVWECIPVGNNIAIGCDWCLHIAWGYQYNTESGLTAAQSAKDLFDMLYMQAKLLTIKNQVIAPPTQIYLGNSSGEIKIIP